MALKPNPVNWFEIPVSNLGRATEFYEHIFGVELPLHEMGGLKMAWFPMVPMTQKEPGAAGSLIKGDDFSPSQSGTCVYFSVEDIDDVLKKVNATGGKTVAPKGSIGEYGFIALFTDTEGNKVGLHSLK